MAWLQWLWRAFLAFCYNTTPADKLTLAAVGVAIWCFVALAYVAFFQPPSYPIFFGCEPRRAQWYTKSPPWRPIFLTVVTVFFLFLAGQAFAQGRTPANPNPGEHVADSPPDFNPHLNVVLVKVGQFETNWYDTHGAHFGQTLRLFGAPPANGNAALPDALLRNPTSGATGQALWTAVNVNAWGTDFWVDVYDGPLGKGYTVTFEATFSGQRWQRVVNSGPESWREADWFIVSEAAP